MAKEVITRLIDDIDGGVAHETVTFEIDGDLYKIDLSSKNAKKLRAELATYVSHGNRVSTRGQAALMSRSPGGTDRSSVPGSSRGSGSDRSVPCGERFRASNVPAVTCF